MLVLGCLGATLILGSALKGPCANGSWADGRQYRLFCYSDIVPLLNTEQLTGNRLPFLQPCLETGGQCDEYPVLTMYFMRVAAWIGGNTTAGFFTANAVLLWICAAVIATIIYMLGGKALWFVLAPTLLIYGFMNWDLFAVALATGALLAFARASRRPHRAAARARRRREVLPGVADGAADRAAPVQAGTRRRDHDRLGDRRDVVPGEPAVRDRLSVELVDVLPVQLVQGRGLRQPLVHRMPARDVGAICGHTSRINVASFALFAVSFVLVWLWKQRREPDFARWSLAFPMLVLFLLSNKVYSPQYGLWLLPFFALGGSDLKTFVAFEVADVAVFLTRFSFFGDLSGYGGLPFGAFEIAIAARTVVLVWAVIAWVRRPTHDLPDLEADRPRRADRGCRSARVSDPDDRASRVCGTVCAPA